MQSLTHSQIRSKILLKMNDNSGLITNDQLMEIKKDYTYLEISKTIDYLMKEGTIETCKDDVNFQLTFGSGCLTEEEFSENPHLISSENLIGNITIIKTKDGKISEYNDEILKNAWYLKQSKSNLNLILEKLGSDKKM